MSKMAKMTVDLDDAAHVLNILRRLNNLLGTVGTPE